MKTFLSVLCLVLSVASASAQVTLTANPGTVVAGQSSTLTYTIPVSGPTAGSQQTITQSVTDTPAVTTTYTFTALGSTATVTVTVTAPPPPPPTPAAEWVPIRKVTGSGTTLACTDINGATCSNVGWPSPRGYNWRFPFDPVNGESLTYDGEWTAQGIYSYVLWGYSARTHTATARVMQTATDNASQCGVTSGSPGASYLLKGGHPLGFVAVDTLIGKLFMTAPLCQNSNAGFTSRYDLATKTALHALPVSVLPLACNGLYNCATTISWDNGMEFVPGYGKTITCCGSGWHLIVKEFDGATYTNVSVADPNAADPAYTIQKGDDGVLCENGSTHCPSSLINGAMLFSDGPYLYLFGGCIASSPSNLDCPNPSNEVYRYTPPTRTWKKLTPAGGVKPPTTNVTFPFAAYDSKRGRLVFYNGTQQWQFLLATNTWSTFTAAGAGPLFDAFLQNNSVSNACGYDPVADIMPCKYSRGQSISIGIFELRFSGS